MGTFDSRKQQSDQITSYASYLAMPREAGWFYLTTLACVAMILLERIEGVPFPASVLKWTVASLFVLLLPGFATIQTLVPGKGLGAAERLVLSVGLSISMTTLLGFALNWTASGITSASMTIGLCLCTIPIGTLATYRKYRLFREQRSDNKIRSLSGPSVKKGRSLRTCNATIGTRCARL
jgi:uncharacterized membrane protein